MLLQKDWYSTIGVRADSKDEANLPFSQVSPRPCAGLRQCGDRSPAEQEASVQSEQVAEANVLSLILRPLRGTSPRFSRQRRIRSPARCS